MSFKFAQKSEREPRKCTFALTFEEKRDIYAWGGFFTQ